MKFLRGILVLIGLITLYSFGFGQNIEFNYNGRVNSAGEPFTGEGQFKFALTNEDGSVTYWANDGLTLSGDEPTTAVTVQISDGFFSVDVGDQDNPGMALLDASIFNNEETIVLRVWFDDGEQGFQRLLPDRKIVNPFLLGLFGNDRPTTIYVNGAVGSDRNTGLTSDSAKKTIQGAVNVIPKNLRADVLIKVSPGVYREQVSIAGIVAIAGKIVRIKGDESWTTDSVSPQNVVISGSDDDVVGIRDYGMAIEQSAGIVVEGIRFESTRLAGLLMLSSSSIRVERCSADNVGGGVHPYGGFAAIGSTLLRFTKCTAENNSTVGFHLRTSDGTIDRCIANGNRIGYGFYSTTSFDVYLCSGNNNAEYGLYILQSSKATLHDGMCYFNNNGMFGILVTENSTLGFDDGKATANQNTQYGIELRFQSMSIYGGGGNLTTQGNGIGASNIRFGSAMY